MQQTSTTHKQKHVNFSVEVLRPICAYTTFTLLLSEAGTTFDPAPCNCTLQAHIMECIAFISSQSWQLKYCNHGSWNIQISRSTQISWNTYMLSPIANRTTTMKIVMLIVLMTMIVQWIQRWQMPIKIQMDFHTAQCYSGIMMML